MDLVENNKEGFESCLVVLNYLKECLDKSEEEYKRKCNPENPNYMDDELWGTIAFDSITEDVVVQTLKKLNLDVKKAREIVFAVTGYKLNYKSNFL